MKQKSAQRDLLVTKLKVKVKVKYILYRHLGSVQAVRPIRGVEVQLYCTGTEGSRGIAVLYRH